MKPNIKEEGFSKALKELADQEMNLLREVKRILNKKSEGKALKEHEKSLINFVKEEYSY